MAKREMMASSKKHPHYDDNDGMMRIPGNGAHLPLSLTLSHSLSLCVYTHCLRTLTFRMSSQLEKH